MPDELRQGLVPFEKIRKACGDSMDIADELHSLWSRPQAIKIAQALERYAHVGGGPGVHGAHGIRSARWRARRASPIAVGETRGGRADFRACLSSRRCQW